MNSNCYTIAIYSNCSHKPRGSANGLEASTIPPSIRSPMININMSTLYVHVLYLIPLQEKFYHSNDSDYNSCPKNVEK